MHTFVILILAALLIALLAWRRPRSILLRLLISLHYTVRYRPDAALQPHQKLVLISNCCSWVDGLLYSAALPRRVRVVLDGSVGQPWQVRVLGMLTGMVRVRFDATDEQLIAARRRLELYADRGDVFVIFAEHAVSPHGFTLAFDPVWNRLFNQSTICVAPAHIDGTWGSVFSYYGGQMLRSIPPIHRTVTVRVGRPVDTGTPAWRMRELVDELGAQTLTEERPGEVHLARAFIRSARRRWFGLALNDTTGKSVTHGKALIGSIALARIFRDTMSESMVGLALPASVGAALANFGLTMAGKVAVNLNFTSSNQAIESACNQCNLKCIISSRAFLERMPGLCLPRPVVFLEDLAKQVTTVDRLRALAMALLAPARLLASGAGGHENATVIFSSGSTAAPKGIVLTHNNILGNCESMHRALAFSSTDGVAAALPFFHSFGYTVTLWFATLEGFRAYYHPNPLDGEMMAKLVRENRTTLLVATPTFLRTYIRKATPADFASLRIVIAGAEKLRADLARHFEDRFGQPVLEGYGATELTPVSALNVHDVTIRGKRYTGHKPGTIGRPLPGVVARVVDPDTLAHVEPGRSGLLLVKGPNVMKGYLGDPDATARAIRDGWYVTGDMGSMDEDGFITLTDRLFRFSKIAGEMVPHGAIEDAILNALGTDEQVIAVTAVPDEVKGERIVVLHTPAAGGTDAVRAAVERASMPNLWRPSRECYVAVDEIPILPTGKTDLRGIKDLALARVGQ